MIVRLITPLTNSAGTLSVIAVDENNNVVIKNIVENVAEATAQNNPDLYRQLWNYVGSLDNNGNYITNFQNLYTNTYLSYANGINNGTLLTMNDNISSTISWNLIKQSNMPNDDQGAPRSYSIHALSNNSQVIDLSGYNTTPGTSIQMYSWKGQTPYDNQYNQFWFLEEPRIVINNPTGNQILIQPSQHGQEVIEAWDSMVGGNLLGTLNPNATSMYISGIYSTFYLSSKRNGNNGQRVNESENETNQVINLSNDSSISVQFYYGDPRQGASITVTATSIT